MLARILLYVRYMRNRKRYLNLDRKELKMQKTLKNLLFGILVVGFCAGISSPVSADVIFVKPGDATQILEYDQKIEVSAQKKNESKSRAPEPSTMVLFGSGVLGMVMTFLRRIYRIMKRLFDIVAAIAGVIILSPLLILTAVMVRLTSKGPIIYSQIRVGENGRLFKIYKFRTMKVDAEKETGAVWAKANDSRITPVGMFLRKAHIDELPQLFNILMGEMSLIGPRPERPVFVEKFKEVMSDYDRRLRVKPGLTGLAQVRHRYDETIEDVKKKLKYDLLYIRKMCFWADFGIILRTFRVVVTGEGAK